MSSAHAPCFGNCDEQAALDLSRQLQSDGFLVPAIRYPTVGRNKARLRISLTALHTERALSEAISRRSRGSLRQGAQ